MAACEDANAATAGACQVTAEGAAAVRLLREDFSIPPEDLAQATDADRHQLTISDSHAAQPEFSGVGQSITSEDRASAQGALGCHGHGGPADGLASEVKIQEEDATADPLLDKALEEGVAPAASVHYGQPEPALERVICADCVKECRSATGLLLHRRLKHPDKRAFQCPQCSLCVRLRAELAAHMRVHTAPRPYMCDFCGKAYAYKHNLVQHSLVHTGERPFTCEHCGQAFTSKRYLVRHKVLHSGVRPYRCAECGFMFARKDKLLFHLRQHIGHKPFACLGCSQRFLLRWQLVSHVHVHSGNGPHRCPSCHKGFGRDDTMQRHARDVCKINAD